MRPLAIVLAGSIVNVTDAVGSRRSIRAFTAQPLAPGVLREVLAQAARAPSGGNLQPWRLYALAGDALTAFKAGMQQKLQAGIDETPEYDIYPANLWEPYRSERYQLGEELYATIGVGRDDKNGRMRQLARNFQFFDAPAALFCYVDRGMGPPQWADLGMYLQTVMLLLQARGIGSCAQEFWAHYPAAVAEFLQPPAQWMLFCGMAIGYADRTAAINTLQSRRMPLDQFAQFRDC